MTAKGTSPRTARPVPSAPAREIQLTLTLAPEQLAAIAEQVAEILGAAPAPSPSLWMGAKEAADYLACPPDRIYDLVQLERLHPHRDGRRLLFRRDELDAYVEGGADR